MKNTFDQICKIELPEETATYTPVSNKELVEMLHGRIADSGLKVTAERYELGREGSQMFGVMEIGQPKSSIKHKESTRLLGFRNSYDKSMPIGFVAGANIIVCSNLMFEGEIKLLRKHTNRVHNDLIPLAEQAIVSIEEHYAGIVEQVEKLKQVKVNRLLAAEIVGEMFMAEEIISSTQINIIKRFWDDQKQDDQTGWDFMNHCTEAMKVIVPHFRMQKQLALNDYINGRLLKA